MIVVIGVVVVMMMRVCDSDGIGHCGNVDSSRWLMVGVKEVVVKEVVELMDAVKMELLQ